MAETVKASVQVGEKLVTFEGPRDFVEEQVLRITNTDPVDAPRRLHPGGAPRDGGRRRSAQARGVGDRASDSCIGRVQALGNEGFFGSQRSIAEIKSKLADHGWHYPLTTLSGPLLRLVQQRLLRRERVKDGRKRVWKYSRA